MEAAHLLLRVPVEKAGGCMRPAVTPAPPPRDKLKLRTLELIAWYEMPRKASREDLKRWFNRWRGYNARRGDSS